MRVIRSLIHRVIVRYLRRCAGAFHSGNYGSDGRYVVLMNDADYGLWGRGKRAGLMQIYKDPQGYFVALPDFSNPQASPIVRLKYYDVQGWFNELRRLTKVGKGGDCTPSMFGPAPVWPEPAIKAERVRERIEELREDLTSTLPTAGGSDGAGAAGEVDCSPDKTAGCQ